MSSPRPANRDQMPPLDPALQSKLIKKFGATLMKRGFIALPQCVQDYYRYVPGKALFEVDKETGEVFQICEESFMTPTEFGVMVAIWSYWWSGESDPWPSVEHICAKMNKSPRQVRRYLQRLRDKGFMLSMEQYNVEGKQISNRYDFSPFLKRLVAFIELVTPPQKPNKSTVEDDTSDRERRPEIPGRGGQECQANQIESDPNSIKEEDSNSSCSAETPEGTVLALRPQAIGTPTTQIEPSSPSPSNSEISNPEPSQNLGAGEPAKEVKEDGRANTVLQMGRVQPLPVYIQANFLLPLRREFEDKAPQNSSASRMAKSYWRLHAYGVDEYAFPAFLETVINKTRSRMHYGSTLENPMAYFFTLLEKYVDALCTAWEQEERRAASTPSEAPRVCIEPTGPVSPSDPLLLRKVSPGAGFSQEEAEVLLTCVQQELGAIAGFRVCTACILSDGEAFLAQVDLEYVAPDGYVHHWRESFANLEQWQQFLSAQS